MFLIPFCLISQGKCCGNTVKTGHDRFLPHSFEIIISIHPIQSLSNSKINPSTKQGSAAHWRISDGHTTVGNRSNDNIRIKYNKYKQLCNRIYLRSLLSTVPNHILHILVDRPFRYHDRESFFSTILGRTERWHKVRPTTQAMKAQRGSRSTALLLL